MKFYSWLMCFGLLVLAFLSSCQKDDSVQDLKASTQTSADTSQKLTELTSPGNFLINKGTLTIKLPDTTYKFDASQDSIAFVNMNVDGKEYYGVTAINKAHTVSFGISSPGAPIAEMTGNVSGCQLLLQPAGKLNTAYLLTHSTTPPDFGIISIDKYNQDTVLAKGTFHTYLAKDEKKSSTTIVDGSFELKVK